MIHRTPLSSRIKGSSRLFGPRVGKHRPRRFLYLRYTKFRFKQAYLQWDNTSATSSVVAQTLRALGTGVPAFDGALTMDSNLQAGSDGCAPTPSQYFARTESSLISLKCLPSPSAGGFGIGSYVPAVLLSSAPARRQRWHG
jgi:hypothetical protein